MKRAEIAALALQSEAVADRMDDVCDILKHDGIVVMSRDEYREHAARYRVLAQIARDHHKAICLGGVSA